MERKPAAARLGDAVLGRQQCLRRRVAHADQHVGIGKLDLAQDEGQADRGFLRRRRAVAGRPPRHDVGDVGARAVEPDRRHHPVEQLAGTADERQARDILVASRRLAHEHHARLRVAVGEHELGRGRFERAAVEALEHGAQLLEARRGLGGLARRHHGGVGGRRRRAQPSPGIEVAREHLARLKRRRRAGGPVRPGIRAVDLRRRRGRARRGAAGRASANRSTGSLADQRVDARLLVEGEQFAGGLVAVGRHGWKQIYAIGARHETMRSGFPWLSCEDREEMRA